MHAHWHVNAHTDLSQWAHTFFWGGVGMMPKGEEDEHFGRGMLFFELKVFMGAYGVDSWHKSGS